MRDGEFAAAAGSRNNQTGEFHAGSLGSMFMEMTVTKTMIGIVLMLVVLPLLQPSTLDHWYFNGLLQLRMAARSGVNASTLVQLVHDYRDNVRGLYYLEIEGVVYEDDQAWRKKHLRFHERYEIKKSGAVARFNVRHDEIEMAKSSIFVTSFIIFVMGIAWIALQRSTQRLGRTVAAPLKTIAIGMDHVARLEDPETDQSRAALSSLKHHHDTEKPMSNVYEIRKIHRSFQRLKGAVQSFAKFVPREVVLSALDTGEEASLGVTSREITIFFSDIAGWTSISESLSPEKLLELLSEYFAGMSTIIQAHGGCLLEFIGDAILAVWNAPVPCDEHAVAALRATVQMQAYLREKQAEWQRRGQCRNQV